VITITSHAVAVLAPNDNGVAGVVRFTQEGKTVHIDYDPMASMDFTFTPTEI